MENMLSSETMASDEESKCGEFGGLGSGVQNDLDKVLGFVQFSEKVESFKDLREKALELESKFSQLQEKMEFLTLEKKEMEEKLLRVDTELQKIRSLDNGVLGCSLNALDYDVGERFEEKEKEEEGNEGAKCSRSSRILEEIEFLDLMAARSTLGLLDLQMMEDEVRVFKGSKGVVEEGIGDKISNLQDGLWELKRDIGRLKGRKRKEFSGFLDAKEEVDDEGEEEAGLEEFSEKERKGMWLNWGLIARSLGIATFAVALWFIGQRTKNKFVRRGNVERSDEDTSTGSCFNSRGNDL